MVDVKDRDKDIVTSANSGLKRFKPSCGHAFEQGFVLEKGEIKPGKDRKSVWDFGLIQIPGLRRPAAVIYFICPRCGQISIDAEINGYPMNCLVCDKCDRHLWLSYDGYKESDREEFKLKGRKATK